MSFEVYTNYCDSFFIYQKSVTIKANDDFELS